MLQRLVGLVVTFVVFSQSPAASADFTTLYRTDTLEAAAGTYNENLIGTWDEDLVARLRSPDREEAERIRLRLPLIGTDPSPFAFYADSSFRRVYVPTLSVKFLDDLAIALAWLDRHDCDISAVFDYVGMIRYKSFEQSIPAPLAALPVPANALTNNFVNDVSGKMLKSAIYFLMAHELAHVLYRHSATVLFTESQAQELEADAYALEVMRRLSVSSAEPVPPLGMVLFFRAASRFEPAPGDFESNDLFEAYVSRGVTHPLTSARLMAMARLIKDNAHDFSGGQTEWLGKIHVIADEIETIGRTLDDRDIRELQRRRSLQTSMESLRTACDAP